LRAGAIPKRKTRTRLRWKGIRGEFLAVFFLAMLVAASVYGFLAGFRWGQGLWPVDDNLPEQGSGKGDSINVLLLGVDRNGTRGSNGKANTRTDTMILAGIDLARKKVSLLSIPRDSRVKIPGRGYEKINHAHVYGGPRLAMQTVEEFLGVPVRYYVRMDFEGFARVIDTLGGVEIEVERDMHYSDPYQDLEIDLKKGRQVLDGEKALQYVRFRQYVNGDIGRVQAQQKFIEALARKVFQMGTLPRLPTLARQMMTYVDTNLDLATIVRLARLGRDVERDDIVMDMVPGSMAENSSDWVPDPVGTRRVVDRLFRGIDHQANGRIRLQVINGTDSVGLAARLAWELKEQGFQVVKVATADSPDYQITQVIDHSRGQQAGQNVLEALKARAPTVRLYRRVDDEAAADVTIIIGRDLAIN